jgi:hypothetical protein
MQSDKCELLNDKFINTEAIYDVKKMYTTKQNLTAESVDYVILICGVNNLTVNVPFQLVDSLNLQRRSC